jgi:hypothetical protein
LGPELCAQFVFVGGAAAGLLITDLAMPAIRRTDDVDIVTNAEALTDYTALKTSCGPWALCKTKPPMRQCAVGA